MVDPGFDFTRQGIGADPLPAIDFSAGFKYLQNQQQLAIQQSRALMAQQSKMAELAVESDKNQIRRAELMDKALGRKHESQILDKRLLDNDKQRQLKLVELEYGRQSDEYRRESQQLLIDDRTEERKQDLYFFERRAQQHGDRMIYLQEQRALDEKELEEAIASRQSNEGIMEETLRLRDEAIKSGDKRAQLEHEAAIARIANDAESLQLRSEELEQRIFEFRVEEKRRSDQLELDRSALDLKEREHELDVLELELSKEGSESSPKKVRYLNVLRNLNEGNVKDALKSLGTLKDVKGEMDDVYLPMFNGTLGQVKDLLDADIENETNEFSNEVHEAFAGYFRDKDNVSLDSFDKQSKKVIEKTNESNVFNLSARVKREEEESLTTFADRFLGGIQAMFSDASGSVINDDVASESGLYYKDEAYEEWSDVIAMREEHAAKLSATSDLIKDLRSVMSGDVLQADLERSTSVQFAQGDGLIENIYDSLWSSAKTTEERLEAFDMIVGNAGYANLSKVERWADSLIQPSEGEGILPQEVLDSVAGNAEVVARLKESNVFNPSGMTKEEIRNSLDDAFLGQLNEELTSQFIVERDFARDITTLFDAFPITGTRTVSVGGVEKTEDYNILKEDNAVRSVLAGIKGHGTDEEILSSLFNEFEFVDGKANNKEESGALNLLKLMGKKIEGRGLREKAELILNARNYIIENTDIADVREYANTTFSIQPVTGGGQALVITRGNDLESQSTEFLILPDNIPGSF